MRKGIALATLAVLLSAGIGAGLKTERVFGAPALQSCDDYVGETNDRLLEARTLLYPADRPGAFGGSIDEATDIMTEIANEQAQADAPDEGQTFHDDILEALTAAETGLLGGPDATAQILFAKSIIYNADTRLLAINESC